ncbi:MAG: FtsX-like permease family protein [Bryobacterales bacterium]|nr:FtsX-like permease family protein [Bryobacterales bacterium]MBV9397562.1 FtsX-like permease family protein [Bryobacterales bacterium]
MKLSLATAARIAWRETRSSMLKFVFVVLGVAAGVGALSGVRGFSQSFESMLTREARTVMAADVTARQFVLPDASQTEQLDALAARGVERTLITETVSMASAARGAADAPPVLVSIKAVDPSRYPYYGTVTLNPAMPLNEALRPDTLVAGEDVLIRLKVKIGDLVRVGGQDYRVAATVVSEPDRMSGSLNIGLRMMMSREAFERTGLMQIGSRAAQRVLFKLEPGAPPVEQVRAAVKRALPDSSVADFRQSHPIITNGLDRATVFLSLVSLIALIVGAIGVGMAMHAHLQQKMDHIAVMKSLGGTSREIMRIYVLQTLMLGLAGGIAGVLVGRGVEQVFPALISKLFAIDTHMSWHIAASFQGIAVGVLTTLLFTLPPLLAIRSVRPALILRRDMPEARLPWKRRLIDNRGSIAAGVAIVAGISGIAAWLAESPKVGAYFAGGLVVSLVVLAAVAAVLLRMLREFVRRSPWRVAALTRQGLANLYRQGNQAQAILVALGLGVMFTLSVYLVQRSLVKEIIATAPPDMPNVFLVGVTAAQTEPLKALIEKQPGVLDKPVLGPSVSARIVSIDGAPISDRNLRGVGRRFTNTRSMTWEELKPPDIRIVRGSWWPKGTTEPVLSVDDEAARTLQIQPGSVIEMTASGRTIHARVAAVHELQAMRATPSAEFIFNREALEGLPVVFYGGVRMHPAAVGALQRAVFEKYPTITVVNIADALAIAQQVIDQIALVIRFLSGFAILAGAIILAASVAGTRFRRVREVVILKTLGATRRHVRKIFSIEFLTLGAVAGLLGSLLAAGFSSLLLKRLLDAKFQFDPWATLVAVAATALLANASGWLASFRILQQKPLEVLREE